MNLKLTAIADALFHLKFQVINWRTIFSITRCAFVTYLVLVLPIWWY